MAFHETYRAQYLQRPPDTDAQTRLREVADYQVGLDVAAVTPGQLYWRVAGVHHLTPEENQGKHLIFVDVVDENGQRVRDPNLRLFWGWEGQGANEPSPPKACDKGDNEPAGNVDLFSGQHTWVRVECNNLPSERVLNLHIDHPDEPTPSGDKWNTHGHHSFYVLFQRTRKAAITTPVGGGGATTPPITPQPDQPQEELHVINFGPFSHQDLINAFAGAAATLGLEDTWALLNKSGMRVEDLAADRTAQYSGAPLQALPNLTVAEKNLLMRQLAQVLATMPTPPHPAPTPVTPTQPAPTPGVPPTGVTQHGNRLGFYLHLSTDQNGLWDAVTHVRPPVILIHADTANTMLLEEIRRFRAPDAFVIGRLYKENNVQRQMLDNADPAGQGRAMAEEILNYNFGLATKRGENGRLLIDGWMSLNEAVPGPASRQFAEQPAETGRLLRNYDAFQVAFHQRLQQAGVEAIAFNFGAGNFSEPAHYLDFFPGTLASYTYLGFHEYGWPTLFPDPGSATSAGLYRRCLAGIRAQYGDRHRVIITEAGLTRMFQNPQWGDVGWLNADAPLSEDQYWRSLEWYNGQLGQDAYVVGACLFEVGHHGAWETFRHLGRDRQGQPLHLVDRIAALNDTAQPRAIARPTTRAVHPPVTISGTVTRNGKAVAGAVVRLIGSQETLGTVRGAALATTSITWTRRVSSHTGALRQAWDKYVAGHVAGLTWAEFKALAGVYNPSWALGEHAKAQPDSTPTLWLPENRNARAETVWDRPLSGFAGSLAECWRQYVENKVIGLSYADFKAQVTQYNPALTQDDGRFEAEKRYNLPRSEGQQEYALFATTGQRGRFHFTDLPPGDYRLEVSAAGAQPAILTFVCQESMAIPVLLEPLLAPPVTPPGPVARELTREPGVGFVRVFGTEFVAGGMPLRFIGVNIRGLVHYGDSRILPFANEGHRGEQVRAARDMGARVIRVFLPSEQTNPQQTADRLRSLVALVKQEAPGMYILPALCNLYRDVPFRVQGDDGFYQRIDPNFNGDLLNADFFTGGYQRNYLPFVQQVVSAFRDEPAIFAWEIGNELKLNPATGNPVGDPNVAAFLNFMLTVAGEIRRLDPNHLITTGMISTHHAWLHTDELRQRLYGSPLFDFLTVHCYNDEFENDDSGLAEALHKPLIIEEAGYGNRFGGDRSGKVAEDLGRWFGRGVRGYMPWGFMATGNDIGDGDQDSGLDRTLHHDWDALFNLYRQRANELAQIDPNWQPPVTAPTSPPPPPLEPTNFNPGQQVFAQDWVNVRKSAGHQNKPADDVLGTIAPGAVATITGPAAPVDGLTWWPLHATLSNDQTVDGWAADAVNGVRLLGQVQPPPQTPRSIRARGTRGQRRRRGTVSQPQSPRGLGMFGPGQTAFALSVVNLRQSPGYVDKPSNDVIGQIPFGAPATILSDSGEADGLTWWNVRGPLLDNSVATGWAADTDPSGQALLGTQPADQPDASPNIIGPQFRIGDTVSIAAAAANIRQTPGYLNRPPEHVIGMATAGMTFTISAGVQRADDLDWWQISGTLASGQPVTGWVAVAAPDGRRLLAPTRFGPIVVGKPFIGNFVVTQGWGNDPDFYRQFLYGNVPLKGHNGIDFLTPMRTPLVAIAPGRVKKVAFEAGGFGHHILIEHAWGETLYAHLDRIEFAEASRVQAGDIIGLSGNSGNNVTHLHFGLRIYAALYTDGWGGFCDPAPFMNPADLIIDRSLFSRSTPMAPELPGRLRP